MSVKKIYSFDFIINEALKNSMSSLSCPLFYKKSKFCSHGEIYTMEDGKIYIVATIKDNEDNKEVLCRIINNQLTKDIEILMSNIDLNIIQHREVEYSINIVCE